MPGGSKDSKTEPWRRRATIVTLTVLALGLVLSTFATATLRRSAHEDAGAAFDRSAKQLDATVERQLDDYIEKLRDIGTYAVTTPTRSTDDFRRFVGGTHIFEQLPAVTGVFFLRRLEESDLPAYEASLASEGKAIYRIGDPPPNTAHYILEQYVPGSVDLGLPPYTDISPITSVSTILEVAGARHSAMGGSFQQDPLITKIANAMEFPPDLIKKLLDVDFFIGLPIFDRGPDGTESSAIAGWISGSVDDFGSIISDFNSDTPEGLSMELTVDLTNTADFADVQYTRVATFPTSSAVQASAPFSKTFTFDTDGVTWHLSVWSAADADGTPPVILVTLLAAIFATILAARLTQVRIRSHYRERDHTIEVQESNRFQTEILDSVTAPMVVLDDAGQIVRSNIPWELLLRSVPADVTGRADYVAVLGTIAVTGQAELRGGLSRVLRGEADAIEAEVLCEAAGRRWWWLIRVTRMRGRRGGAVVLHTDVTERKRSHDDLAVLATRDALTGLPNRRAFAAELESALLEGRSEDRNVGVIFIDLDGFKPINDEHGHAAGDAVLQEVAARLNRSVRTSDRIARLGGDEFVVLVSPVPDQSTVETAAERILAVLDEPMMVKGRTGPARVVIRASIGAAISQRLTDSGDALLDRADVAMYQSKQDGGARLTVAS
ncbi:MAG: diguanylate cyclase [Acidimicrobiales bacterium]|nr:diguanylate cyclase [Acidimicrobiales bacterium]